MIYVSFFPLQIPIYFEFLALTRYEFIRKEMPQVKTDDLRISLNQQSIDS